MVKKVRTRTVGSWVAAQKQPTPDYSPAVVRSMSISGYTLEPDETFFMAIILATEAPGGYPFTRLPIASGETVDLIDILTGLPGITPPADWDYIIKGFWCNFNQPVMYIMDQAVVGDRSCECHIPAFSMPEMTQFDVGWTRNQVEPIGAASLTEMQITNLGADDAIGKAWIIGFMKPRIYIWY